MTQETFITMTLHCCQCGEPTIVHALTWAAMPVIDEFICPDCTKYVGDINFPDTDHTPQAA